MTPQPSKKPLRSRPRNAGFAVGAVLVVVLAFTSFGFLLGAGSCLAVESPALAPVTAKAPTQAHRHLVKVRNTPRYDWAEATERYLFEAPIGTNDFDWDLKDRPVPGVVYSGVQVYWTDAGGGIAASKLVTDRLGPFLAALDVLDYRRFMVPTTLQWCERMLAFGALSGASLPVKGTKQCLKFPTRGLQASEVRLETVWVNETFEYEGEDLRVMLVYVAENASCLLGACPLSGTAPVRFALGADISLRQNDKFEVRRLELPLVLDDNQGTRLREPGTSH